MWNSNIELDSRIMKVERLLENYKSTIEPKSWEFVWQHWYNTATEVLNMWTWREFTPAYWKSIVQDLEWNKTLIQQNTDSILLEVTDRITADNSLQSSISLNATAISLEVTDRTNADGVLQSSITINSNNINLKVSKDDVINQINISTEWILIEANNIEISWSTTFSSGYDPSTKIVSWWAAADVNGWVTTINWWKITTNSITAWSIAFNYAWSASEWGNANDTDNVNWTSASTVKTWAANWTSAKTATDSALVFSDSRYRYKNWLDSNLITDTKVKTWFTGVIMDWSGLFWYNSWTKNFEIDTSWNAYFRWDLHALSWTFAWNITSSAVITWGTFRTSSWDERVEMTSDRVNFYNSWAVSWYFETWWFLWLTWIICRWDFGVDWDITRSLFLSDLYSADIILEWSSNRIYWYDWTNGSIYFSSSSWQITRPVNFSSNISVDNNIDLVWTTTPYIEFDWIKLEKSWTDLYWNWVKIN
jgi:hypothetical protein